MYYIINGSPRSNGNTATLLHSAENGIKSVGKEVEWIELNKLNFKGCISCFACKQVDEKFKNHCIQKDDLSLILEKLLAAEGIIIGSPIYYMNINGATQSFIERFFFPNYEYTEKGTCFPNCIPSGFIFTMNLKEELAKASNLISTLERTASFSERILGEKPEIIYSFDTKQFSDYSKYICTRFSEGEKDFHKREQFPKDVESAFAMGVKIATNDGH